ncbi:MAG: tRNA 2-thiouridine(34) synthase MnmA [Anaerolineae bacterium]
MGKRVIAAMSGGVDSSVAAALLREQGYEVIGIGLRLPGMSRDSDRTRTCCGTAGMEDARRVAQQLDIPFYVLNYEEVFDRLVIEPFCLAYTAGRTPNPCIDCNVRIKFGVLLDTALAWGADYLATGHYARVGELPGHGAVLQRARDAGQDQSYFLYALSRAQLAHALFPIGELSKTEVREIARRLGLPVAEKPASQDICFLPERDYRSLVAERWPQCVQPGEIVDTAGRVLGRHVGTPAYTVGQRRGLGVAAGVPLYVLRIDPARNRVIVGRREQTFCREMWVEKLNWLAEESDAVWKCLVKTRHRGVETPAEICLDWQARTAHIRFLRPHPISAPGQAAVFYDGEMVLGGGVIADYA